MRDKIQENIENRIKRRGRGKLFVNADFADLGTSVGKICNNSDRNLIEKRIKDTLDKKI